VREPYVNWSGASAITKMPSKQNSKIALACEVCQRKFPSYRNLRFHFANRHPKTDLPPRPLRQRQAATASIAVKHYCNVCKESFTRNSSLHKHTAKRHPGVDPCTPLHRGRKPKPSSVRAPVKCQWCDRAFASRGGALRHRRVTHPETLKPLNMKGRRRPEEKETLSFPSFAGN
jgi:hypothetical protein